MNRIIINSAGYPVWEGTNIIVGEQSRREKMTIEEIEARYGEKVEVIDIEGKTITFTLTGKNRTAIIDMDTITRKSMLYKTGVEYGDYTMNHVLGCAHGCKYPCYAQMQKQRYGVVKSYEEWCEPKLVSNTLELLDKEIPKLKDKIMSVQLCFSTDPFMEGFPEVGEMSIKAIRKLNDAGIKCTVLTKGILPIELSELSKENEYGITLVTFDEEFREWYEPHTAKLQERYNALKALHDEGCKTWVSVEPYPTPNILHQRLADFLCEITPATDRIIFGRMNYNSEISKFEDCKNFYNLSARIVREWCEMNGLECHIKSGTEVHK